LRLLTGKTGTGCPAKNAGRAMTDKKNEVPHRTFVLIIQGKCGGDKLKKADTHWPGYLPKEEENLSQESFLSD
jgi:hypothetical protein